MSVRAIDLRINTNNFPAGSGQGAHADLNRRIYRAWRDYNESDDAAVADAGYAEWCRLVEELRELPESQE